MLHSKVDKPEGEFDKFSNPQSLSQQLKELTPKDICSIVSDFVASFIPQNDLDEEMNQWQNVSINATDLNDLDPALDRIINSEEYGMPLSNEELILYRKGVPFYIARILAHVGNKKISEINLDLH